MDNRNIHDIHEFVDGALQITPQHPPSRPFTVLTFAQSLDGVIGHPAAAHTGTEQMIPLILSGPESMTMTHAIRARVDAVLVGVRTVITDDPRLNVRLVPVSNPSLPRPVILDTWLRCPVGSKVVARGAIILCRKMDGLNEDDRAQMQRNRNELEKAGATVAEVSFITLDDSSGCCRLDLAEVGRILYENFSIQSMMVEGGASVISDFLQHPKLLDRLIITIAPRVIGRGVRAIINRNELSDKGSDGFSNLDLTEVKYKVFGRDVVLASHVKHI